MALALLLLHNLDWTSSSASRILRRKLRHSRVASLSQNFFLPSCDAPVAMAMCHNSRAPSSSRKITVRKSSPTTFRMSIRCLGDAQVELLATRSHWGHFLLYSGHFLTIRSWTRLAYSKGCEPWVLCLVVAWRKLRIIWTPSGLGVIWSTEWTISSPMSSRQEWSSTVVSILKTSFTCAISGLCAKRFISAGSEFFQPRTSIFCSAKDMDLNFCS
mmetsp:Transcript_41833/g.94375  ORF Transcript_41833/g.94375 Transcript_41833/m.94375 type:complete len:215 (-) Transcript_41833:138-782(-)